MHGTKFGVFCSFLILCKGSHKFNENEEKKVEKKFAFVFFKQP